MAHPTWVNAAKGTATAISNGSCAREMLLAAALPPGEFIVHTKYLITAAMDLSTPASRRMLDL